MTKRFTIGDICKEVQRIQTDIETNHITSAISRCERLNELLDDIEGGKHILTKGETVQRRRY